MAFAEGYRRQVVLLLRALPHVAQEDCFALKGGTAINLFIRNLPRLSVDIDLTYLPVKPRAESLAAIDAALKRIAARIHEALGQAQTSITEMVSEGAVNRLVVRHAGTQIKIEVTPVLRGCVFEPEIRRVSPAVESTFGFAEMRLVSFADLYAGKIVAALDRQHPRDLFDVRGLLANESIDNALRAAFIVYLLSHNRPMAEILAPKPKPIGEEFHKGFGGMTAERVSPEDLIAARDQLTASIVGDMPDTHRRFLLSFKQGKPDWSLLEVENARDLPAVRWRQQNLKKLNASERDKLIQKLEQVLFKTSSTGVSIRIVH
jgi:predicted nucleotidyltransferase component of viral defense system